jgi:hypothetical protein
LCADFFQQISDQGYALFFFNLVGRGGTGFICLSFPLYVQLSESRGLRSVIDAPSTLCVKYKQDRQAHMSVPRLLGDTYHDFIKEDADGCGGIHLLSYHLEG